MSFWPTLLVAILLSSASGLLVAAVLSAPPVKALFGKPKPDYTLIRQLEYELLDGGFIVDEIHSGKAAVLKGIWTDDRPGSVFRYLAPGSGAAAAARAAQQGQASADEIVLRTPHFSYSSDEIAEYMTGDLLH